MKICFTGHRPKELCGYNQNNYMTFVKQLQNIIETQIENGCDTFITGGAQGFDQLAFWAVNNAKKKYNHIKNIVYLPFPNYGERWKKTGLFSQHDLDLVKKYADEIQYVVNQQTTSIEKSIPALMERNHQMIKNADLVIALTNFDYKDKSESGGTLAAIREAKHVGKPVLQLKYSKYHNELKITEKIEL